MADSDSHRDRLSSVGSFPFTNSDHNSTLGFFLAGRVGKKTTLERELLKEINTLNIGPMGLGGKTTALAVNIEKYPTHIAGLPVAVNISCHALRIAKATL